jgi:hypothetical protein
MLEAWNVRRGYAGMMAAGYSELSASLARSVKVELPGAAARRCRKPVGCEAMRAREQDTARKGSCPKS